MIPLTERSLPIFDLAHEARASGSRTSLVLLPRDVAARRAKNAVAEFPDNPDDLWGIKMRPEVQVSIRCQFVLLHSQLLDSDLVALRRG